MWIDKTMNKIISEAEEEFSEDGISREQIRESFYIYWKVITVYMKSGKYPRIHLPKFGYLRPKLRFVKFRLNSYKTDPKWGDDTEDLIKVAEEVVVRLETEAKKRKRK